jgi:uncharacterized protein
METKKSKVYFAESLEKILGKIDLSKLEKKVAVKVHFGERGNVTYLGPEFAQKVYNKIKSLGKDAALVECNVLYKGSRTNAKDHIATARVHGFQEPIDILDGEFGKDSIEVNGCKIGKGIENYDSLVVLTHFKGHMHAGFGGSIKNIGMGLGSRAGKLDMHSTVKPSVNQDKCVGCGVCIKNCNDEAIYFNEGKAEIDETKCSGCAMCISVCELRAVNVPWQGGTSERLQEKMAEYAKAILSIIPEAIFINVLHNITEECDCMGIKQKPMMKNVGILASEDIVAVDKASLDLANEYSKNKFSKINSVDKYNQIKVAEELGLGNAAYEFVKI